MLTHLHNFWLKVVDQSPQKKKITFIRTFRWTFFSLWLVEWTWREHTVNSTAAVIYRCTYKKKKKLHVEPLPMNSFLPVISFLYSPFVKVSFSLFCPSHISSRAFPPLVCVKWLPRKLRNVTHRWHSTVHQVFTAISIHPVGHARGNGERFCFWKKERDSEVLLKDWMNKNKRIWTVGNKDGLVGITELQKILHMNKE